MKKNSFQFFLLAIIAGIFFTSCVAKRKYIDAQLALRYCQTDSTQLAYKVSQQNKTIIDLEQQVADTKTKLAELSQTASNTKSALSQSNQALQEQQQKLQQLQQLLDQQKQQAENLRKKMADALVGFKASDLSITQKNGKVYVSLSENLLFPSGSAVVNDSGKAALSKLAEVLNANPDINIDIEGHTDSIPIRGKYQDNWALSTARATSIVRILTKDYQVDPTRVIASGHSYYEPVASNTTADGRAKNRRTDIILSPQLDELYKLLEQ